MTPQPQDIETRLTELKGRIQIRIPPVGAVSDDLYELVDIVEALQAEVKRLTSAR